MVATLLLLVCWWARLTRTTDRDHCGTPPARRGGVRPFFKGIFPTVYRSRSLASFLRSHASP